MSDGIASAPWWKRLQGWPGVAILLLIWLTVTAPLAWQLAWVYDDPILLEHGNLSPPLHALRVAVAGDFWQLAPAAQQVGSGLYRPLLAASFIMERAIFGASTVSGHLVNMALHALTAVLVGAWARQRGSSPLLPAAIVLVHPLAAELMGVVTNRSDLLAGFFLAASLVLRGLDLVRLGATAVLAACLCKEVAFVAPLLWWIDRPRREVSPLAAAVPVLLVLALHMYLAPPPPFGSMDLPGAFARTGWAAADLVFPFPGGPIPAPRPMWAGAILAGALILFAARARFLVAWIVVAWAPMAGWLPVPVREGRGLGYVALLGFAVAMAELVRTRPRWSLLLAPVLVGFAFLQHAVLEHHRRPVDFWEWATVTNPDSALSWSNLGSSLAVSNPERATTAYLHAEELARAQGDVAELARALTGLGWLAYYAHDRATARRRFEEAVQRVGADHAPMAVMGLQRLQGGN